MTTYRTSGPWGAGKGSNLTSAEVDANFHDHDERIDALETYGASAVVPTNVVVSGSLITFYFSNETEFSATIRIPRIPEVNIISDVSKTLQIADIDKFFLCTEGCAVSVPDDATVDIPVNSEIHFRQHGASAVTFAAESPSVTTLHGVAGYDNETARQGSTVTLKKIAADEWIILGHLKVSA